MKMYIVYPNMDAIAVHGPTNKAYNITTKKTTHFTETITDRVAYMNGRYVESTIGVSHSTAQAFNDYAENDHFVFYDQENDSGWYLIIPSIKVGISA